MKIAVKFRIKGTRWMETPNPLSWGIEADDKDHATVARVLSQDDRHRGNFYPPEDFIIEEVHVFAR